MSDEDRDEARASATVAEGPLMVFCDGGLSVCGSSLLINGDGLVVKCADGRQIVWFPQAGGYTGKFNMLELDYPNQAKLLAQPKMVLVSAAHDGMLCLETKPTKHLRLRRQFMFDISAEQLRVSSALPGGGVSVDAKRSAETAFTPNDAMHGWATWAFELDGKPTGRHEGDVVIGVVC